MKNFALIVALLIISIPSFSQTQISRRQIKPDAFRPVSDGVLASDGILTFDEPQKTQTISVTTDIALSMAGSGNKAHSRIYLTATGDGSHVLTFDPDWEVVGSYNPNAVNE